MLKTPLFTNPILKYHSLLESQKDLCETPPKYEEKEMNIQIIKMGQFQYPGAES